MAKKSAKSAMSAIYIPEELVTEILIRLPVKTLVICKSVCKTWLSTISNPYFTKSQLHRAIRNPTVLSITKPGQESVQAELKEQLVLDKPDSYFIRINSHVMPRLFSHTRFVNSYDGIICLDSIPWRASGVYLWNPSIGQYKELPLIRLGSFSYSKEGFGYDSISDDYKVVRILYQMPADHFVIVHVYSNNANSWREFKNPILKKLEYNDRHSIVVNGVLYLGNEDELITFDLHLEVLGLVSLPSFDKEERRSDVMDFQGSVAVFFRSKPDIIDLWTLDGLSMSSWTKKFSIYTDLNIRLHFYLGAGQFYGTHTSVIKSSNSHVCKKQCHRKNLVGKVCRRGDSSKNIIKYDYESKEMRDNGLVAENVHVTLKYSETLVSLDGFTQVESNAN